MAAIAKRLAALEARHTATIAAQSAQRAERLRVCFNERDGHYYHKHMDGAADADRRIFEHFDGQPSPLARLFGDQYLGMYPDATPEGTPTYTRADVDTLAADGYIVEIEHYDEWEKQWRGEPSTYEVVIATGTKWLRSRSQGGAI